jgi:hypothetical protein
VLGKTRAAWSAVQPHAQNAFARIWAGIKYGWGKLRTKWQPLPKWTKALILIVAFAPIAYHFIHKAMNPPFELQVQRPGSVPYDIYLVDVNEVESDQNRRAPDNLRLDEATLLRPFGVVAYFYNLVPKRAYQLSATVVDDDGQILQTNGARNLQSDTGAGWVYFPFYPDLEKHRPGSWKAIINVSGVGPITHEFTVKDLTAEQKLTLAQHEEAREQAKLAFSHIWVVAAHQKIKTYATATRENQGEAKALDRFYLFQVAGLDYRMEQLYLSQADKLNGITYRGVARFTFTVFRIYTPEAGWSEWIDLKRQDDEYLAPMLEAWAQMFPTLAGKYDTPFAPHMLFQLEKRDGHWWTVSQEGMRFTDGSLNGKGDPVFIKAPKGYDKQVLKSATYFQPTIEAVAEISDDGRTPRGDLLQLAKKIQASPDVLKKQQKLTMEAME